jgi:hypothetical protein
MAPNYRRRARAQKTMAGIDEIIRQLRLLQGEMPQRTPEEKKAAMLEAARRANAELESKRR